MQPDYTPAEIERFWSKVDRSGGPNACWLWTAGKLTKGYGSIRLRDRAVLAHRLSAQLAGYEITGKIVGHHCDTPSCVNPTHLFVGTQADNLRDMQRKGRSTYGSRHGGARLTDNDVLIIRAEYATGHILQRELAARYGIAVSTVCAIVRGKLWKHI